MQLNTAQLYGRCGYSSATKPTAYGKNLSDFKEACRVEYKAKNSILAAHDDDFDGVIQAATADIPPYPFDESCKGLDALSMEDIKALNNKYNAKSMTLDSKEFDNLLSFLHGKGVISDKDFVSMTHGIPTDFDKDGQPISFNNLDQRHKISGKILEQLYTLNQSTISKFNEIYKIAREQQTLPIGAELFDAVADGSKSVLAALEKVFLSDENGVVQKEDPQWQRVGNFLQRYMGKCKNETTIVQDAFGNRGHGNLVVPMAGKDMLHCSFPGTNGSSVFVNYAEGCTEENPLLLIQTTDENGNMYEQLIHPEDIDPQNATYPQMLALNAHLRKIGEITGDNYFAIPPILDFSKPFDTPINYAEICQKAIDKMREAGYANAEETKLLDAYLNFFNRSKNGTRTNILEEVLKEQAEKQTTNAYSL